MSESVMFELVDIKQEIDGTVQHPSYEQGSPDANHGRDDTVHSEQKQPDDIGFNLQHCDRNCETCQKYIRKLREHVRAIHGVGGQPLYDPIILEIPYVNDSTPSDLEIKCEVEDIDAKDWESETEMLLETGETSASESDSDDTTTVSQKFLRQNRQRKKRRRICKEDPLETDIVERNDIDSDPDYSEVSNQNSLKPKTGVKPFKCSHCGKRYTRKSILIVHQRIHNRDTMFSCDECDKSFTRLNKLTEHKRVHSGERPFKCDQCDKSYTVNFKLTEHKRSHTGERPYVCDMCGSTFARADIFGRHKKNHTEQRPYQCDVCEKSFALSDKLTLHKKTHTGVRPYKCDECEKTFPKSSNLSDHKKTHTGERPFHCDQCEKSFGISSNLTRHKISHKK